MRQDGRPAQEDPVDVLDLRWSAPLAIAGIPFLSGFYSKDAILAGAPGDGHRPVLFGVGLVTALLTAFYMARLLFLTFFGEFRGDARGRAPRPRVAVDRCWCRSCSWPSARLVAGYIARARSSCDPVFRLAADARGAPRGWLPVVATRRRAVARHRRSPYYLYSLYTDVPGAARRRVPRRCAGVLEAKYGFDDAYDGFARARGRGRQRAACSGSGVDAGAHRRRGERRRPRVVGRARARRRAWSRPGSCAATRC